jgi:hypothetical protein
VCGGHAGEEREKHSLFPVVDIEDSAAILSMSARSQAVMARDQAADMELSRLLDQIDTTVKGECNRTGLRPHVVGMLPPSWSQCRFCLNVFVTTEIEVAEQQVSDAQTRRTILVESIEEARAINTQIRARGEEHQLKAKAELEAVDAEVSSRCAAMIYALPCEFLFGALHRSAGSLSEPSAFSHACRSSAHVTGSRGR